MGCDGGSSSPHKSRADIHLTIFGGQSQASIQLTCSSVLSWSPPPNSNTDINILLLYYTRWQPALGHLPHISPRIPHPAQSSGGTASHLSRSSVHPEVFPITHPALPSLTPFSVHPGQFSPQVDERCFTYCSQSISGRLHGNDPWCRTICFRRVFTHEVTRVLAHHRTKTVKHVSGRKPIVEVKDEVESVPVNHPLPPEGQRYSGWLAMLVGDSQHAHEDDPHGLVQEQAQRLERETKYWQEGWYLWWTSSRWASQEKLDLMRRDLKGQTEWQRLKDRRNDEWARGLPPFDDPNAQHADGEHPQVELHPFEDLGNMPPFPDVT